MGSLETRTSPPEHFHVSEVIYKLTPSTCECHPSVETELQAKSGGSMSICDLERVIITDQLPQDPNGAESLSKGPLVLTNVLLDYGYLVQLRLRWRYRVRIIRDSLRPAAFGRTVFPRHESSLTMMLPKRLTWKVNRRESVMETWDDVDVTRQGCRTLKLSRALLTHAHLAIALLLSPCSLPNILLVVSDRT